MTCPVCRSHLLYGRWEIIRMLTPAGMPNGWRARWHPSPVLLCPDDHSPFDVR